jgi:1-acyl-sn-glycerol-3-phosphate acyltransferase
MPWSPCDESCVLAARGGEPRVGAVWAGLRMAGAFGTLLTGGAVVAVFPLLGSRARAWVMRWWLRAVLATFGVRLRVSGAAVPRGGALLVTNHVSWLDIVALELVAPCRMVAKREVRDWFLVGRLATAAGSLYLDRERLRELPLVVGRMASVLNSGAAVAVFPEGTTWCGRGSGRYRSAAFQAAIDADVPVVPVALRFLVGGMSTSTPSDVGLASLWVALRRTARLRGLVVEAEVLPALSPRGHANRRALALAAERAVALACGLALPAAVAS